MGGGPSAPLGGLKLEIYEAFGYDEVEDEGTGTKEWVINLLEPTFLVRQELENLCRFDPYIMCRVKFKNKKWVAFYSDCGNVAKSRAFAFALIAFETAQADQREKISIRRGSDTMSGGGVATLRSAATTQSTARTKFEKDKLPGKWTMIQLARTRECLVCAEYEREHALPWAALADDKEAFEERLAAMVAMQQASARPGARGSAGRGAERSITFDAPVDSLGAAAKRKPPGCTSKLMARLMGNRLPHQNRMGDPDFIMSKQARPVRRPKTKLYDKDEQTQRDFDALYKLANSKMRPTQTCKVPCRAARHELE
jgi:hypothetical protein